MKSAASRSVDLRGFAWPLATAERLRQHQLEQARAQVTALHQEQQACRRELDLLRAAHQQASRDLAPAEGGRVDTAVRTEGVHHLQRALSHEIECEQHAMCVRAQIEQAQRSCTQAQQRLEAMCKLRDAALAAYVQDGARRDAKNADLAWLATHGAGSRRCTEWEGGREHAA